MDDQDQNNQLNNTPTTEVKSDADSQLSEEGEIRGESTSSDVHEQDRADSPIGESELENQAQAGKGTEPDKPISTSPDGSRWYVIHTYSGHENKVATALKQRIESEHLEHKILEILVPTQEKIEIRSGKKETVKEKIFPGYILVKMVLDDSSWLAVRTTQGVTSFIGMGNKPTPIPDFEVETIIKYTKEEGQPTFKQIFTENDTVKIIDGPFAEFIGKIESVDKERGKVKVLVSIFGRETPVELDFLQVAKL